MSLFRLPTATTFSSSTGSATATEELRPVGACRLGALTQPSGSYGRFGRSGGHRPLRDGPSVYGLPPIGSIEDVGPDNESWTSGERRLKIQSTTAWSQCNISKVPNLTQTNADSSGQDGWPRGLPY